ncbi:MAG: zinc ribbon domain-containing protein [Bacillota bacterium]
MIDLKDLWNLQQMRLRYNETKNQLKSNPLVLEMEQARQLQEKKAQTLRKKEELYHQQNQTVRRKEMDYETMGEKQESLRQRLYGGEVANPKELHNLELQLEGTAKEISQFEEELLNLTIEKENFKEQLDAERSNWVLANNSYQEIRNKYEDWKLGIEAELAQAAAEYRQLSGQVAPDLLKIFNEQRPQFNGKVLARVDAGTCGGCRVKVPAMIINQIKSSEKPVRCESCGRILYLETGI